MILAHSLRRDTVHDVWEGVVAEWGTPGNAESSVGRQEIDKCGAVIQNLEVAPSDPFPATVQHLLQILLPSNTAPPGRGQLFKHMSL